MHRIIGYCGLVCTDCPAYIATKAEERSALEEVAARWREEFNSPNITVQSVICDGCLGDGGRHCSHWHECEIRACGQARGVMNCAYCPDYVCERLDRFFDLVPNARAMLEKLRNDQAYGQEQPTTT